MQLQRILLGLGAVAVTAVVVGTLLLLPSPQPATASGVGTVAAGGAHTCAVVGEPNGVKCWGWNLYGQVGDRTTTNRDTPADVCADDLCTASLSGVTTVTAGDRHTCALIEGTGGVKCWGNNEFGQLGNGTTSGGIPNPTPLDVCADAACIDTLAGVTAVAAGDFHTCALTATGGVKCWGRNFDGQLGDGTFGDSTVPVDVSNLSSGVAAVSAGLVHTCALTTAGGVKCWGNNSSGQLGDGTTTGSLTPVDVCADTACISSLSSVAAVAAGSDYTCALTTAGGVKCWGNNAFGQLGDGTTNDNSTPVDVAGLGSGASAVAAQHRHSCALTTAGGAKCWGFNLHGQVGDGTTGNIRSAPVDVCADAACTSSLSSVAAVTVGDFHSCARSTAGAVLCWGRNDTGSLGDGTMTNRSTPVDVVGLGPKPPTPTPTNTPTTTPTATATSTPTITPTPTNTPTPKPSPTPKDTPTPNPTAAANQSSLSIDADCEDPPKDDTSVEKERTLLVGQTFHICIFAVFPTTLASGYQARVDWGEPVLDLIAQTGSVNDIWADQLPEVGGPTNGANAFQNDDPNLDGYLLLTAVDTLNEDASPRYEGPVAQLKFSCEEHGSANIELRFPGASDGSFFLSGATEIKPSLAGAVIICVQGELDSDVDGCTNQQELGPDERFGGRRNPLNPWDFYDVNRDKVVNIFDDIIPVAEAFGPDTGANYAPEKDRSPPPSEEEEPDPSKREPWDLGPPDGVINVFDDIFGVAGQFGHDCM